MGLSRTVLAAAVGDSASSTYFGKEKVEVVPGRPPKNILKHRPCYLMKAEAAESQNV